MQKNTSNCKIFICMIIIIRNRRKLIKLLNRREEEIQCSNPDCRYKWKYKGSLLYATCPSCRRLIRTSENKTVSLQSEQVGEP
jgi:hypothetical protein